ncbi:hypothetical protein [Streptomyces sp. NPDC048643]|uniref:hypothetical protein n=1 Tax=Streptomyces sp. NPDC048643 TaxID=3155637 RepID=UPI0034310E1E
MPQPRTPRTLLAIPASPALLGMARTGLPEPVLASSQGPVTPASDTAPLADEGSGPLFAGQGDGIARADQVRARRHHQDGRVTDPALEPAVLASEFCPRTL